MAKSGVSIFCLQEVMNMPNRTDIMRQIISALGESWEHVVHVGVEKTKFGMGTAFLWNASVIHMKQFAKINLPRIKDIQLHEKLFALLTGGSTIAYRRRCISADFVYKKNLVRIMNIHLDHVGGVNHRKKQLSFFLERVGRKSVMEYEILCGDFNSFDLLKTGDEKEVIQNNLGDKFIDVSSNISWTADLFKTELNNAVISFFIKKFYVHVRRKLDYIWVKNVQTISCKKLQIEGSDHYPIVASLVI